MFKSVSMIGAVSAAKLSQTPHQVPHDYGDEAAISAQHAATMAWAGSMESARQGAIATQHASDIWRGKGPVTAWESAVQREVGDPDYGDPAAIAAQHKFTMDQAAGFEASRVANVANQAASDVWRAQGPVTPWQSAVQREVPHDYGDPAAISEQHAFTTAQAAVWEAARKANVANQAAADVWRGQGAKIAWESAAQREVPHDYGDPAAISAQHAFTMDQAAGFEASRTANVANQAASDVWRGKGAKIAWEPAFLQFAPTNVPHDYGDEAAIAEQHAETMAWAGKMEGSRKEKIAKQAASDVWRGQGMKIE